MFETYSEKARRTIFFARLEASQYGSRSIQTEHLLLGLLRENSKLAQHILPGLDSPEGIRAQIENAIERGKPLSTSAEVPLSVLSKLALRLASEERIRLNHRYVGNQHLLMGLLLIKEGAAAKVLQANPVDLDEVRERVREIPAPLLASAVIAPTGSGIASDARKGIDSDYFQRFPGLLKAGNWSELLRFFASQAAYIDAFGRVWSGRDEIKANMQTLFAPFATKRAKAHQEKSVHSSAGLWIGTLLWEEVHLSLNSPAGLLRMTLTFGNDDGDGPLYFMQVTPVEIGRAKNAATS